MTRLQDTERAQKLGEAIESLARELPEGWTVEIGVENGSGVAHLFDPKGIEVDLSDTDYNLTETLVQCLELAKAAV
jgi:hypothetical protein